MEAISKESVASVRLIEVRVSEDELAAYEAALSYALDTMDEAEIELHFGASVDELEGMRDDLRDILEQQGEAEESSEPLVSKT